MHLFTFIRNGERAIILTTMNKSHKTIGIGVVIFFLLVLAGVAGCFSVSYCVYSAKKKEMTEDSVVLQVREYAEALSERMKQSDFLNNPDIDSIVEDITSLSLFFHCRVLLCDSGLHVRYDSSLELTGSSFLSSEAIKAINGKYECHIDENAQACYLYVPFRTNQTAEDNALLMLCIPFEDQFAQLAAFKRQIIGYSVSFLFLLVILAVFVCRKVAKPMKALSGVILDVSDGYRNEAIEVRHGYRETSDICEHMNRMIQRLNEVDESRQAFVSNVSHELKTPMASMKVLADSLLMQEGIPEEMYREFLTDINSEIDRENGIISDLLTLVKMDSKNAKLQFKKTHVNKLLNIVLSRVIPLASKDSIEVVFENFRDVYADVDENKLLMAFTNIVENAVKYNRPGGYVHVSLNSDISYFYISVEDSGIGIPEEALPYLFERFYRVDKARSRSTGGNGLGLSISYEIIRSHKGEIKVYSKLNEGTTFAIRIPLRNMEVMEEAQNA